MRKFALVTVVALGTLLVRPAAAQGSLAGTWNTDVDIGMRIENGVETSMGKRPAIMTLTVKGDSVFGTWVLPADGTSPAVAANQLRGTRAGTKVTLKADPIERTRNINGEAEKVKLISTFTFELKDGSLVGTSKVGAADGSFETSDRPFLAKRAKP